MYDTPEFARYIAQMWHLLAIDAAMENRPFCFISNRMQVGE